MIIKSSNTNHILIAMNLFSTLTKFYTWEEHIWGYIMVGESLSPKAQPMREDSALGIKWAKAIWNSPTILSMLAILPTINLMDRAWCSWQMSIISGISKMDQCKEMDSGGTIVTKNMWETGKTTKLMAMESILLKKAITKVLNYLIYLG